MTALRLSLLTAASLLALAACKPAQPPASSTTPPPPVATTTPATTDPVTSVDQTPAAQVTDAAGAVIDSKALAGEFEGDGSKLMIQAEGTYRQTLKAAGAELSSEGTWSADGPGMLLLDPQDKQAHDVRFEVVSADELHSQDGTYTFKRTR